MEGNWRQSAALAALFEQRRKSAFLLSVSIYLYPICHERSACDPGCLSSKLISPVAGNGAWG
jgi:hypothetical protein